MKETLLTAARRVVRSYNIDMNHGGLIARETEHAIETLHRLVSDADNEMKATGRVVIEKEEEDGAAKIHP